MLFYTDSHARDGQTEKLDLPTHFFFGLAIGLVFFGDRPEFALLVALGALLPDLDREYWFIPAKRYAEEQRHRALLHNVVVIALAFAVSPFLSLGVFLHVLQDSFTTVKDRGVEWFYPFTRLVKRGEYDANGVRQPEDPEERVYFYQEDPPGLVKFADQDLQETLDKPVPWRRVYGFALNSHLLDRGFLFGSVGIIAVWFLVPSQNVAWTNIDYLTKTSLSIYSRWLFGLVAIGVLFLAGEIDRRDKVRPILNRLKPIKVPVFIVGLVMFALWVFVNGGAFTANAGVATSQPFQLLAAIVIIPVVAIILIKTQTKGGKQSATV